MKLKEEYLKLIEREEKEIKLKMKNPYKEDTLNVLKELKERINKFRGGNVVLLSDWAKSWNIFKGGNCEVIGKHLFQNPNKEIYSDGFFNFVGSSQRNIYSIKMV